MDSETLIKKTVEIARQGVPAAFPNPLVGALILADGEIIGSGYHARFGDSHAEVIAIESVQDKARLVGATLVVNLEPCAHHGKTPPCVEAIINARFSKVIVGTLDPNPLVAGKGVSILRGHGIEVVGPVLIENCVNLNSRFFCNQISKRPYIVLKWAESKDRFISRIDGTPVWFTTPQSRALVHRWRSIEGAIMVGTNTVVSDNPLLTVRDVQGLNPVRVVLDRTGRIPINFNVFDSSAKTIVFTEKGPPTKLKKDNNRESETNNETEWVNIPFDKNFLIEMLSFLFARGTYSILIEGGTKLIESFLSEGLWDEARVFQAEIELGSGIPAPSLKEGKKGATPNNTSKETGDSLTVYFNQERDVVLRAVAQMWQQKVL